MKLIGMTDFVIRTNSQEHSLNNLLQIRRYASFLKQPLELWMFVPCKLDTGVYGAVLNEPDDAKDYIFRGDSMRHEDLQEYQQAKERCLFDVDIEFKNDYPYKGVDISFNGTSAKIEYNINTKRFFFGVRTIEDLTDFQPKLTQTAIKQLSL